MGRTKQRVITGHQYRIGMHTVLGHANMDGIERIRVGEKVAWTPGVLHPDEIITDSYTTGDNSSLYSRSSGRYSAQIFKTTGYGYYANQVKIKLYRDAAYDDDSTVAIYGVGIDGFPDDNNIIAESDEVPVSDIEVGPPGDWVTFIFSDQFFLAYGTEYAIVFRPQGPSVSNRTTYQRGHDNSIAGVNPYLNGIACYKHAGAWRLAEYWGLMFEVYQAEGSAPNHQIMVDKPKLFGGNKKEGGVGGAPWRGRLDLLFGDSAQARNSYLQSECDSNIPAFRGVTSVVHKKVYVGNSPYLKPWSYLCRRISTQVSGDAQWYPEKAHIRPGSGNDLNAAHIIRECLIDNEWGSGFDVADIDDDSFTAAADTLYDEGFGLSMIWDQSGLVEDFIGTVLSMIAGFLYQDLTTGKWVLSLTREPEGTVQEGYTDWDDTSYLSIDSENYAAQVFTVSSSYELRSIKLRMYRLAATSPGTVTVSLREVAFTPPIARPTGSDLVSSTYDSSELTADTDGEWVEFDMQHLPIDMVQGHLYAIVVECTATADSGALRWLSDFSGSYSNGNSVQTESGGVTVWSPDTTKDNIFEVYGLDTPTYDENEIMEISSFARPSYGEITNQVVVNWWDKYNHKPRPAIAHDLALIEKQGSSIIEQAYTHYGICNKSLANKVAERELRLTSSMLASMAIKANRKLSHLKPNSVFKLHWDDLNITEMYVRVVDINYGNLEKSEIVMSCVEDVFAPTPAIYSGPADTEWVDPVSDAADVTVYELIETPYWVLINELDNQVDADARLAADNDASRMMIVANPPSDDSFDYEYLLQHAAGLGFNSEGTGAWTPSILVDQDIYLGGENLVVTVDGDSEYSVWEFVAAGSYAIINNEIIQIVSLDADNLQITIARGLFDTVPAAHSSGDRIWFIGSSFVEVETDYTAGGQPQVKFLPRTGAGALEEDDASTYTASAMDSRQYRPYCPGNLKFNAERYPTYLSTELTGEWTLSWAHRDRVNATQAGSQVLHTDATDYGPEATANYTLKIYDEDNNLIRTATGLTGTSYSYIEATEISDAGSLQKQLRFVLYGVRDGYDSFQTYDVTIKRTLEGSVSGVSDVPGTNMQGCHLKLAGSCVATSDVSAYSLNYRPLAGSVTVTSGVDGILDVSLELAGSSDITSGVDGTLDVP